MINFVLGINYSRILLLSWMTFKNFYLKLMTSTYCVICGQWTYQKAFLNCLCQSFLFSMNSQLSFLNVTSIDFKVSSYPTLLIPWFVNFRHSHKTRKDSLEKWVVYIEIGLVSWNLLNSPKHRGTILRNMASFEEDQQLPGAFHAIMDKIEADILHHAKKWDWKWKLQLWMPVLLQSTCTFKVGLWKLGKI